MSRIIHFYVYDPDKEGVTHGYMNTVEQLKNGEREIHTTSLEALSTVLFDNGYAIVIHTGTKDVYLETPYEVLASGRQLTPGTNLKKLLFAGEFGSLSKEG